MNASLVFLLLILASCSNPFQAKGALNFKTRAFKQDPIKEEERLRTLREAELERKRLFLIEKNKAWTKIVTDAVEGFKNIESVMVKKCFDCHDKNTKTPVYGRIFPRINPVYHHQQDGIKALDFSQKFPLLAQGSPSQISLLKAIKNEVMDRSMPLKAYTIVYRSRKVNANDQESILAWVDPIIQNIEEFERKFDETQPSLNDQVHKILDQKCFRCHANGINRGKFGDMQDTPTLMRSKFVDLKNPSQSLIYKLSVEKKMPPNKRDALNDEELLLFNDWLDAQAREIP